MFNRVLCVLMLALCLTLLAGCETDIATAFPGPDAVWVPGHSEGSRWVPGHWA